MEDESPLIQHLESIIRDYQGIINQQRCRIAELEYDRHMHDLIYTQPISFLWWFWRCRVFPFSLLYGHERVD